MFTAFADPADQAALVRRGRRLGGRTLELDFRVGGRENSRFRFKGGPLITNDTVYQDIVPDERIIIAYAMAVEEQRISVSLATMEFLPEARHAADLHRAGRLPRRP